MKHNQGLYVVLMPTFGAGGADGTGPRLGIPSHPRQAQLCPFQLSYKFLAHFPAHSSAQARETRAAYHDLCKGPTWAAMLALQ